jgi:hypothetical protein
MYLEYKGVSVNRAEIDCGISSSGLSKQLPSKDYPDGKSIGSENLEKFLNRYTDLSADWLLRGAGSMIIGGTGKAKELEEKIAIMSHGRKNKDAAYDIVIGMIDVIGKTYDFYKEK